MIDTIFTIAAIVLLCIAIVLFVLTLVAAWKYIQKINTIHTKYQPASLEAHTTTLQVNIDDIFGKKISPTTKKTIELTLYAIEQANYNRPDLQYDNKTPNYILVKQAKEDFKSRIV